MSATITARLAPKVRRPLPLRPRRSQERLFARAEALALLIDALDALEGDVDLEPEEDRCVADDDKLTVTPRAMGYPGDKGSNDDDAEPDNEDCCLACDDRGTFHRLWRT